MFVVEVYNPDKHATHYAVFNNMQDAKRCAMENFKEDDKISVIRVQAKETMVIWDPNA